MKNKLNEMVKDKAKLSLKLFILVWIVLLLHVILKFTFNYWQPYVIPTPQLQEISNFIDKHKFIVFITNFILYYIDATIMFLCGLRQWKFKDKKQLISFYIIVTILNLLNLIPMVRLVSPIALGILIPLIYNYKSWLWILLTFGLCLIFLAISSMLSGISHTSELPYVIKLFFDLDYYIMFILGYFTFNFLRIRKEIKNNG